MARGLGGDEALGDDTGAPLYQFLCGASALGEWVSVLLITPEFFTNNGPLKICSQNSASVEKLFAGVLGDDTSHLPIEPLRR